MSNTPVFLFGTLRFQPLLTLVAGRDVPLSPAKLSGARCAIALAGDWPVLVDDADADADGFLIDADEEMLERLDYYEAVFGYARQEVHVETQEGSKTAQLWRPNHDDLGRTETWEPGTWAERWGDMTLIAAADIMRRMGRQSPQEVGRVAPMLRSRADAVVRTRGWKRPGRTGNALDPARIEIVSRKHPYDGFFSLEEIVARHPRFDGEGPETAHRAVFRATDAATVLPYDPIRDRVLFIEQIRFGALAQGDPAPWLLEPVAGLIDAGETPEDTARREAVEEAGVILEDLHFVSRYYPSPGGVAQVLFSYVGIADLPDAAAQLGGHADEGEDILGHVVSFDDAMVLLGEGDLVNAPAIITMQWLEKHRARLRAAAGAA